MQDVLLKINGRGILWQSFDDIQELLIDLPGTAEITFGRPKAPWHAMAMAHQWEVEGSCCCCFWLRSPSLAIGEKGRFWVPTTKARLINYDQLMFYWAGGFAFLIGIILTYFSGPFYQSSSCLRFIRLSFINPSQRHVSFICLIFVSMFRQIVRGPQQDMPTMLMIH